MSEAVDTEALLWTPCTITLLGKLENWGLAALWTTAGVPDEP